MKKLAIIAVFLSFFSCINKNTEKNDTDNTSSIGQDPIEIGIIYLNIDSFEQDSTSFIREYEFVFRNGNDSLTLLKNGIIHGDYIPMEQVGKKIVVPGNFIRFHDKTGTSLIVSPEFLAEKIQESTRDVYPCFYDSAGYRVYRVDIFDDESELEVTFYKYAFDKDIMSTSLKINGEIWESNYFDDFDVACDIKKAISDFNEIDKGIDRIESMLRLFEFFESFNPEEDNYQEPQQQEESMLI